MELEKTLKRAREMGRRAWVEKEKRRFWEKESGVQPNSATSASLGNSSFVQSTKAKDEVEKYKNKIGERLRQQKAETDLKMRQQKETDEKKAEERRCNDLIAFGNVLKEGGMYTTNMPEAICKERLRGRVEKNEEEEKKSYGSLFVVFELVLGVLAGPSGASRPKWC